MSQLKISQASLEILVAYVEDTREQESNLKAGEANLLHSALAEAKEAMKLFAAHYRCPSCGGASWIVHFQSPDEAGNDDCVFCERVVEPYFIAPDTSSSSYAELRARAMHEKQHPVPHERGIYSVEVSRTVSAIRDVDVADIGPANAELQALDSAGNYLFSSESDPVYAAEGYTMDTDLIGKRLHWLDPDDSLCSKDVVVTKIKGDIVECVANDGSEIEAQFNELIAAT